MRDKYNAQNRCRFCYQIMKKAFTFPDIIDKSGNIRQLRIPANKLTL